MIDKEKIKEAFDNVIDEIADTPTEDGIAIIYVSIDLENDKFIITYP